MSLSHAHPPMVIAMVVVTLLSSMGDGVQGNPRCCGPNKMTVDMYSNEKISTNYLDFNRGLAIEDWKGRQGVDYVLLDINNDVEYRRFMDGTCAKSKKTHNRYLQCIPSDAQHYSVSPVNGVAMDGYRYKVDDMSMDVIVESHNCIPRSVTVTYPDGSHAFHDYSNTPPSSSALPPTPKIPTTWQTPTSSQSLLTRSFTTLPRQSSSKPSLPPSTRPATRPATLPWLRLSTLRPSLPPPTRPATRQSTRPATLPVLRLSTLRPSLPPPTRPATRQPTRPATLPWLRLSTLRPSLPPPTRPATRQPTRPATLPLLRLSTLRPSLPPPTRPAMRQSTRPATLSVIRLSTLRPSLPPLRSSPPPTQPTTPSPQRQSKPTGPPQPSTTVSVPQPSSPILPLFVSLPCHKGGLTMIDPMNCGTRYVTVTDSNGSQGTYHYNNAIPSVGDSTVFNIDTSDCFSAGHLV